MVCASNPLSTQDDVAAALVSDPRVLVLDEPLSALDENTREHMYMLLNEVQQHTGVTALHITHSSREAEQLADRVLRMEDGKVREEG